MAANNWTGTTNSNWNVSTNWSLGAVPTSSDGNTATFTSSSPNCTINATSLVCNNIDFTNYTHTLTFTNNLEVFGNITLGTGATFAGADGIYSYGSGTLTSNGVTLTCPYGCANTITLTIADSWTCGNSVNIGGATTMNGNNIYFNGGTTSGTGSLSGTTNIYFGATTLGNLTINNPYIYIQAASGTFTFNGTLTWDIAAGTTGYLTYNSGTCTSTTSGILKLAGGASGTSTYNISISSSNSTSLTNSSGLNLYSFALSPTTNALVVNVTGNLTCNGTFSTAQNRSVTVNGGTIYLGGNISLGYASGAESPLGSTNYIYIGTGTFGFSGASTSGGFNGSGSFTINTSGTLTFTSGDSFNFSGMNLIYTAGTVVTTGTTLVIGTTGYTSTTLNTSGITWNNINFANVASTVTLNSLLSASGTVTFASSITFAGSYGFSFYGMTINAVGLTISLVSSNTYTITNSFICTVPTSANSFTLNATTAGTQAILNLNQGASQTLNFIKATDINSSAGQTIWCWSPTLSNTLNWNSLLPSSMQTAYCFLS